MEQVKGWSAGDGEIFQTKERCIDHEIYLKCKGLFEVPPKEKKGILEAIKVILGVNKNLRARGKNDG